MKVSSVAFSSVTLTLTERRPRPPSLLARYLEREKTERSERVTRGCYLGVEESRDDERMNERRTDYLVVVVDAVNDILSDEFEDAGVERRGEAALDIHGASAEEALVE